MGQIEVDLLLRTALLAIGNLELHLCVVSIGLWIIQDIVIKRVVIGRSHTTGKLGDYLKTTLVLFAILVAGCPTDHLTELL